MSNTGGGGGGGAVGVAIPENVRKTLQSIREITGKQHSDEDIYTVLKDCSMDPNESAQKLLYLDTFHEVKRKRNRRKEASGKQGRGETTQGRGARGGRGNYSANYTYPDAVGGRNAAPRRENGVNHTTERGSSTSLQAMKKSNIKESVSLTKVSTITPNGPSNLHNGSSTLGRDLLLPTVAVVNVTKNSSVVDVKKQETFKSVIQSEQGQSASSSNNIATSATPASIPSGVYSSASDSILVPSMTQHPGAAGAIKREAGSQWKATEQNHIQGNRNVPSDVEAELPNNEKADSLIVNSINQKKAPGKSKAAEKNHLSEPLRHSTLSTDDGSLAVRSSGYDSSSLEESVISSEVVSSEDAETKASSQLPSKPAPSNGHVTFPNNFKVLEALKSGLTFGSFDANPGLGMNYSIANGCDNSSMHATELSHAAGETAKEPSYSIENGSLITQVDHSDKSESPQNELVKVPQSEGNVAANADSEGDQSKQEIMMVPEGHLNPTAPIAPNYGFGIMPPVQGGHLIQFDGHETQAQDVSRVSTFVSENPTVSSSPSPPVQNSIAASPQPFLFRPPFSPISLPYGPYFNHPIYLPAMHQFLSHNGLPQQPSTGNAYLTPTAATAPGVKVPLSQFKPGTSAGNPTPIGLSPFFASYGSSAIGFNPGPVVTSGSSTGNEDLSASRLKESHVYNTGLPGELSAWQGQDLSSLQLNSLYHLHSQGQHLAFSPPQAGHGPFSGIYPPVQAMAAPSTVNPLLQQSQAMSAAVETVGPPSVAYQQPQLGQVNWNSSYQG